MWMKFEYVSVNLDEIEHVRVNMSEIWLCYLKFDKMSEILATTASRWILAATAFSRLSRSEFQHSSPTFGPGILTTTVGTSSWRASPAVGNASVDDTDAAVATTFFFATDSKIFVYTFNYYLRNMSQCRTTRLLVHLSSSDLLHQSDVTSLMQFSMW
jgi:hypothetical protein